MIKIPEFSRPLELARVPAKGCHEHIAANTKECTALAKRMDVPAIHTCAAKLHVTPWRGGGLKVTGQLTADLDQTSVISLEAFRSSVTFDVERYFLSGKVAEDDDADPIEGGAIDLGEIVAETMGLELDPYPRRADEAFTGFETDTALEEKVSPFAALVKKDRS
jgi:uncharacterized metal-binding protein YceD (DUF177 family)